MSSVCITLTSPFVLNAFLLGHIARLAAHTQVVVCINRNESDIKIVLPSGVRLVEVEIRREISPAHDLLALYKLWNFYRSQRFSAVFTVTPKAGLLGMVAAWLARIPVRIHFFTGQVWANKRGLARAALKAFDRMISGSATHLLVDSPSQRDFLVSEGIVKAASVGVLGDGSISGVDVERFKPDPASRSRIRQELGINPGSRCLIYVGRMKRDKGVQDLLAAFQALHKTYRELHLILVGPDEENLLAGHHSPFIHSVGYTTHVARYMAAADIFCLPSYREGFGSVLIEAAAMGLPSVASRIYGITDAVAEGETGLLHSPGDTADLQVCLEELLENPARCEAMGKAGRERAIKTFGSDRLEKLFAAFVLECIAKSLEEAAH